MRTTIRAHETVNDGQATLRYVDPATLVVGANVRSDAQLDPEFVQSIKERGVREAIVAYADETGALVVLRGQRRTLAALETKCDVVPVLVEPKPDEPDRLVDQLGENDHRRALRAGDRVAAFEQLAAFGVTRAQIAKRTSTPRPVVDAALAVAGSEVARSAANRWDWLDIPKAAILAEFEDDREAVKELAVAAREGGFDHTVQRLRDARAEARAKAEAAAALTAVGVSVVERPDWSVERFMRLRMLKHGDAPLTVENHASCPGHAAYLTSDWVHPDESDEEEDSFDNGTEQEAVGPQARPEPYRVWVPEYLCMDAAAHGHVPRFGGHDSGTGRKKAADMNDTEREQARTQRRDVIDSNKAWESAEKVRRQWLRTFLQGRKAPTSAAAFIAGSLARTDFEVTQAVSGGNQLAHELLGLADQAPKFGRHSAAMVEVVGKASDSRAQMIALGLILAAYEEGTDRNCWRAGRDSIARYLRYLEANGYELSTVEKRACGEKPSAAATSPVPQPAAA
ncbi:ParB/RepB/Spo0J family partition protein [Phytohabitans houttuyneae]|uniref:ParB-like N-terminal domain-containing protein n=1 Tax=Phytohabitans houttuyneae TaxID=1076126 RepID=A0A6V8KT14_9ACTN|nr:ParB N-terminal domain-containing protein [Phytohabitans houttuyneae]GFJ85788.1 hypothetical protein Phou_099680 [Phytohabitans houttuyneae]